MPTSVTVEGAEQMQATLHHAAARVADMSGPNREVANLIAAATRPPRRTGRLAGSIRASSTATDASVTSALVYAPVIEYGWPAHNIAPARFLAEAADRTRTQADAIYSKWAGDVLSEVQGA